jgi:hypothetical protein
MRPAASSFTRRPGVAYAPAPDGHELPVIDVTNSAFRVDSSAAGVEALRRAHFAEVRRDRLPAFLIRAMLPLLARRSLLVRTLVKPEASYLGGLMTYALKLGAENLAPPFDRPIDRRIGASAMVTSMRVRLQQTAELIAEGLKAPLGERPAAALHLVDIAGGPAMDSLNALILLSAAAPGLLARPVAIHVLDLDEKGPRFGAAALAALQAEGGPLAGSRSASAISPMTGTRRRSSSTCSAICPHRRSSPAPRRAGCSTMDPMRRWRPISPPCERVARPLSRVRSPGPTS